VRKLAGRLGPGGEGNVKEINVAWSAWSVPMTSQNQTLYFLTQSKRQRTKFEIKRSSL